MLALPSEIATGSTFKLFGQGPTLVDQRNPGFQAPFVVPNVEATSVGQHNPGFQAPLVVPNVEAEERGGKCLDSFNAFEFYHV